MPIPMPSPDVIRRNTLMVKPICPIEAIVIEHRDFSDFPQP
jgi:hypothetical protein